MGHPARTVLPKRLFWCAACALALACGGTSATPPRFYKLSTLIAYVHEGRYELALTGNFDDGLGFHEETMQVSVGLRLHR